MNLKDQFLNTFKTDDMLTTKDIIDWYSSVKHGNAPLYYANVYNAIINPLLHGKVIEKIERGYYKVIALAPEVRRTSGLTTKTIKTKDADNYQKMIDSIKEVPEKELDEFDLFLQDKLK
jgi:hypothetical protein